MNVVRLIRNDPEGFWEWYKQNFGRGVFVHLKQGRPAMIHVTPCNSHYSLKTAVRGKKFYDRTVDGVAVALNRAELDAWIEKHLQQSPEECQNCIGDRR